MNEAYLSLAGPGLRLRLPAWTFAPFIFFGVDFLAMPFVAFLRGVLGVALTVGTVK